MKWTKQNLVEPLPEWAQQVEAIEALCRLSGPFSEKVRRTRTAHWRKYLARMAERCMANRADDADRR